MTRDLTAIVNGDSDTSRDVLAIVGGAGQTVTLSVDASTDASVIEGLQGGTGPQGPRGFPGDAAIALVSRGVTPPELTDGNTLLSGNSAGDFVNQMAVWQEATSGGEVIQNGRMRIWFSDGATWTEQNIIGPQYRPTVSTVPPGPADDAAGVEGDTWFEVV